MTTLGDEIRTQAGVSAGMAEDLRTSSRSLTTWLTQLDWEGGAGNLCQTTVGGFITSLGLCADEVDELTTTLHTHALAVESAQNALATAASTVVTAATLPVTWGVNATIEGAQSLRDGATAAGSTIVRAGEGAATWAAETSAAGARAVGDAAYNVASMLD